MSKIINFFKVIRRNWKKSTFFFGVATYGVSYGIDRYQTFQMMRAYCEEAKRYGEQTLPQMGKPKHVTVIINPEANDKKSSVQYEKFAAPLLHLAGLKVSVFQTDKEKQAQELMRIMSNTDAVIVAGGNGTLHEVQKIILYVVTGLMMRPNVDDENLPLGIIPLGKTNTVAEYLFGSKSSSKAQLMAEAAMAVVRETRQTLDVMKVQCIDEENPVYAMSTFEHGALSNVQPLVQKKWYLGPLKDRFVYFVNSLKAWSPATNDCLEYVANCSGCSNCAIPPKVKAKNNQNQRWWEAFMPRKQNILATSEDYKRKMKITNTECGTHLPLSPSYSNISVSTRAAQQKHNNLSETLWIKTFPESLSFTQFISSGLNNQGNKLEDSTGLATIVNGRELIIKTAASSENEETEDFYFIDNEKYKCKSCHISLIPNHVTVYA